jgi:nucleotide-binding universal stress UspA family protein
MLRPVVAGVDGSPESLAATEWAAREAARRNLPLHLLHASNWTPPDAAASDPAGVVRRQAGRAYLHKAEDRIARTSPQVRPTDEQIDGPATAALLHAADRAELLVLGSRGLSGITGFLLGSVALGVVARATRPVVLVEAEEQPENEHVPDEDGNSSIHTPYRDVVLGIDLSDACDEVIEFAFEAARVRGATLRVVHAWSRTSTLSLGPGEIGLETGPQQEEEWRGFLTAVLQTWREKFPGVEVAETVIKGRAGNYLVHASSDAGLLVVGRHTREGHLGPHTGPVVHSVIRHAHCPVAVVPHD